MTRDERIAAFKAAIKAKEEAEAQIDLLTTGGELAPSQTTKSAKKCKLCGQPGHRSDGCPNKHNGHLRPLETADIGGRNTPADLTA